MSGPLSGGSVSIRQRCGPCPFAGVVGQLAQDALGYLDEPIGFLVTDPDEVARVYADMIDKLGVESAPRRLGIKIDIDAKPTHDQLADLTIREGLSMIYLDPAE